MQEELFTTTVTGVDRDHALARFTDPDTSRLADVSLRVRESEANQIRKGTHRHLALVCFVQDGPKTADEVAWMMSIDGIWKRVSDLKNMGFIAPTGDVRLSRAGRQAEVLAITDAGRRALEELA